MSSTHYDDEIYKCKVHEERISVLENNYQSLAVQTATVANEIKNLNKSIDGLTATMNKISQEIAILIPRMESARQWEDISRNGIFFFIGLLVSGIVAVAIHHFTGK